VFLDPFLQPFPGEDNLLHRLQKDLPAGLLLVVFVIEKTDLIHNWLAAIGKLYFRSNAGVFQILLRLMIL